MAVYVKKKTKKKKGNIVIDWLVYVLVKMVAGLLHAIGIKRSLKVARFLGRLLWKHYKRGRKRAIENLRESFPEKDEQWIINTGKRSFEQIAMLAIDVFFTPRLVRKDNWRQYARFINIERAKWMMKEKKGLILLTAHYGNFEIIGYLMGLFGFDIYSIARPLDNKFLNEYFYGVRRRHGQKIVDKKGAAELMPQIISEGSTIGFIADQDAGPKGVFVDFFGRKASTYKSIGLLAITNDIPIGIGYSRRVGDDFFFEVCASRVIMPKQWKDKDDPLLWVTQEFTKAIEDFIREDPTQYWWLHRRWKHRPKEEKKG